MKEYLPIGTVVILKDGEKSIMIYGRKQIHAETNVAYDYVACLYPEGNLNEEYTYLFNHDQIKDVLFTGYVNEDETEFLKVLNEDNDQNAVF
jgi:hypothetical protein